MTAEESPGPVEESSEELHRSPEFTMLLSQLVDDAIHRDHRWDKLGRLVRNFWIVWAEEQKDPKPSWLVPWEELDSQMKEADSWIGHCLYRFFVVYDREAFMRELSEEMKTLAATGDFSGLIAQLTAAQLTVRALTRERNQLRDAAAKCFEPGRKGPVPTNAVDLRKALTELAKLVHAREIWTAAASKTKQTSTTELS